MILIWHDMTWYNNILYSIIAVFFLNWMVFNWMGWKHNVDAVMRPELAGSRGRFGTLPWAGELKWYTGQSGTCNMWGLSENGVKLMRLLMFNYGIEIIKWEYPSMIEILMGYTNNDIWYMGYVGYAIKPYQNHVVLWGSIIVIGQTNSRAFGLWKVDGLDGTEWGIYHCQRRILKGQHVIARVCLKIQYPPILRVCQHSLH